MKSKLIIVLLTVAIVFTIGFVSIYFFGDYGWTVFIFLPFLMGFLPSYFASKRLELTTLQSYGLSFTTLLITVLVLISFGIEGIICVLLTLPILTTVILLSTYVGCLINNRKSKLNRAHATLILAFYSLSFLSFDYINEPDELISVKEEIVINAPVEKVWKYLINFDTIPKSDDFIFNHGIAYPISTRTNGNGLGAMRYANYSTGIFVQSISEWDEPNQLSFNVESQPAPMREWNPFWNTHPPHLDGYYKSIKGQFRLQKRGNNVTLLEGTTWYRMDIYPQFYWKIWVNTIIKKVHQRALEQIKSESEKDNAQPRNTSKII